MGRPKKYATEQEQGLSEAEQRALRKKIKKDQYREYRTERMRAYRAAKKKAAAPADQDKIKSSLPKNLTGMTLLDHQEAEEILTLQAQYEDRLKAAYRAWFLAGKPNRLKPDPQADEYNTALYSDPLKGVFIHKTPKMSRNKHREAVRELCLARAAARMVCKTRFGEEVDAIRTKYESLRGMYRQTAEYHDDVLSAMVEQAAKNVERLHAKLYEPWRLKALAPDPDRREQYEADLVKALSVLLRFESGQRAALVRAYEKQEREREADALPSFGPAETELLSPEEGLKWKAQQDRLTEIRRIWTEERVTLSYPDYLELYKEEWTLTDKPEFDKWMQRAEEATPKDAKAYRAIAEDRRFSPYTAYQFRKWQRSTLK